MERKMNKIILVSIIGAVFFMSIGYSVLNRELNISGELSYRPKADIRITNITQKLVSNATILYANFTKNEISLAYNSQIAGASVSFEVEVTNYTDSPMGILKIENLPESATIEGYNLKEALKNSKGVLKAGDSTTFTITFKASTTDTQQILLIFDFREVCKVTYNGFSNTEGFKTETLKEDNFSQNIGTGFELCSVTMNGSAISNYNFSNGVITISNVTGNIVIDVYVAPKKEEPTIPNKPELNGDMIPVYYDEEETVWKKADINNVGNSWYDYNTQKWANAVTTKNIVKDLSGNNNDGTIHGAIVSDGKAILDGVDDYIDVGLANYDFKNSITLVLKFKFNDVPVINSYLFGNWEIGGGGFFYSTSNNLMVFTLFNLRKGNYDDIVFYKEITTDEYYTIVGTYDGKNESIYINGEKIASQEVTIDIGKSPYDFIIGGNPNGTAIGNISNITISDALIFDKSLTEEEIQSHYSGEVTLGNTSPLVYYNFEGVNREYYKQASVGTKIEMDDINTMWVWIPRYSYTIKSENGTNYYGKRTSCTIPSQSLPGEIDVKFITVNENDNSINAQYTGNKAENWRTNDAFNFDGAKAGIWVGKFEITGSYTETCKDEICNVSGVTILPNQSSIRNKTVSDFFYMSRSMQMNNNDVYGFDKTKGDLHIIKNDEWGAIAYLSQSKYGKYGNSDYSGTNKEIYQNKSSSYITGSSNGTPGQSSITSRQYKYNDMTELGSGRGQAGPGASTTGTIYGVYDMSGGAYEYVMGVLEYDSQTENQHPGEIATGDSEFKGLNGSGTETGTIDLPDKKYYNTYKSTNSTTNSFTTASIACDGGVCFGHALSETASWYSDSAYFVYRSNPWFERGGYCDNTTYAGVFFASYSSGTSYSDFSSRVVLV